jgi:hypothetical protein
MVSRMPTCRLAMRDRGLFTDRAHKDKEKALVNGSPDARPGADRSSSASAVVSECTLFQVQQQWDSFY